jgi:uncharacterized protein (DUF2236 family)
MSLLQAARARAGQRLFEQVAGPDALAARARIHGTPGPRWFPPGSPICRVHSDAAMYVGGLLALLMQSLHPLAMAAVAGHSGFRSDPWGRLARTSRFLAETTFATSDDAERAVAVVRAVHSGVRGVAPDGRPYRADDPHLLSWVHVAEVDSFLRAHQRYGAHPLSEADAETYVAQAAVVARKLGAVDVPTSRQQLDAAMQRYRPELEGTPAARAAARFVLLDAPIPLVARAPYTARAAAAVGLLPPWASAALWIPRLPLTEVTAGRLGGRLVVEAVRWLASAPAPGAPLRQVRA